MFLLCMSLVCAFLLDGVSLQLTTQDERKPTHKPNDDKNKYNFETVFLGNYYQSTQFCNYHGLSLLSIESAEENDYVFKALESFLGNGDYTFWTSGTRLPQTHWVWLSTGKPIVYSPWKTQPTSANCLDVRYTRSRKTLLWSASACKLERHTICETPSSRSVTSMEFPYYNSNLTLLDKWAKEGTAKDPSQHYYLLGVHK